MKTSKVRTYTIVALSFVLSAAVAAIISCGGRSTTSSSNPTTGTVQTFLSDPPTRTCSTTYASVFVTITKVEANISSTSSSGWQTLVDLTNDPKQVDLLTLNPSANPAFCGTLYLLAKQQLPPGKYQQIRLILLANNASNGPSTNNCGTAGFNCVVPQGGSPVELQLPSEAQTGIKIPASQIGNGGLTVTAGQNTDLNIDINTCASIVKAGNSGKYLLKPVLHAGEVSVNNSVISGKVVEASGAPSPNSAVSGAIVLLEQPDPNDATIDRVVMTGSTGSDGTFSFCPLSATSSNVDIVVTGQTTESSTTTTYNPTVLFNVPIGSSVGNIPIYAETVSGSATPSPAMITGTITTAGSSGPASGNVQVSALQQVQIPNTTTMINLTIPVFGAISEPPDFMTTNDASCGANSTVDCVGYSLQVPASSPAIGTYSGSSNSFTAPSTTGQASYTVNAVADGSDSLLNCTAMTSMTSASFKVMPEDIAAPATGTGITVVEPTLAFSFTGCQ
jgi:Domain of unknown function (DUF4382)